MESVISSTELQPQVAPLRATGESPSSAEWRGPLFVIGMWRSGTSLLYALLNKHPQIALMYEGDLMLLRPLFWKRGARSRWLKRWEFWNQALQRHGLDANRFAGGVPRLRTAAAQVYREYALQKGALIWGDKSPNYFDSLTRLFQDFPDARFIVIWRDPASICRSVIRAGQEDHSWFDRRGMTLRVLMGMQAMRAECDRLISRGASIHELQYQSLVRNPTETMKDICTFLGITYVSDMTSLNGADRKAIYDGGHHSLVKGERIVASAVPAEEVLPRDLKRKIERYTKMWREENGGEWPPFSFVENGDSAKPSRRERMLDLFRYRCLRGFDAIVILIYCFAPLSLLKRFRALKHEKREEASQKIRQKASPSPDSI